MLFKILHGDATRISTDVTPYHEGWCYVTHDGNFYVDMNNERTKLNAKDAESLAGASLATVLNSSDIEIPTSKAVSDALANKTEAPKLSQITLRASAWTGNGPYAQAIAHSLIGPNTQIDIKASTDLLNRMEADGVLAIFVENNNGTATVRARGGKFSVDVVVSLTFTEIEIGA